MRYLKLCMVFLPALLACNSSKDDYFSMCNALQQAETIYQHPNGERFKHQDIDTIQIPPELAISSDFFVKRKEYDKAAKASLYYGYAQIENGNLSEAVKLFKDAEQYGITSGDSLTTARAQYNIARMLYASHDHTEAIIMAHMSEANFGSHYDERSLANNIIAISYIVKHDFDNAKTYLEKSLELAEKGQSIMAKSKVLNNYSVFYREQEKYDDAINYLIQMKEIEIDSSKLLLFNLNMGKIYLYNSTYDSAAFYTNKALELSNIVQTKPETRCSIYQSLYYIKKKQGDYPQALAYLEKHENLQYQIQKENEKKSLYSIQRQYDYEALQNKMNQQIIQKQTIILAISFALLLVSIVVIGLLIRQRNLLKENKEIKQELDKTKGELQNSVKPEIIKEELSRQLHRIISANRINERANDYKKEWSPLVFIINNKKDNLFEAAVIAIERVYPEMYDVIRHKYPDLNDTETKVLLLSCSDLTNAEIGYILGLSVHSVNKSKSEIKKNICQL